jgi:cellulose synthase/poly-beta-1,6-N-acetylglucosamine synthase-like glycosyltransferase
VGLLVSGANAFVDFWAGTVSYVAGLGPGGFARVFWAYLALEVPRYLLTDLLVLVRHLRGKDRPRTTWPKASPLVSVVLPALNEEETIADTVRSIREQDYRALEIVVVDDGSTDRTAELCEELARAGSIRFFRFSERQGKSAALNFGTRVAAGDVVVYMDTDSSLDRNAISTMLKYLDDERVGAVSGNLGVRNVRASILTRLQAIEYLVSITVGRSFRARSGILAIVPGAFGMFRRELLERVGGHEPGPGNDSDLTIRVRKLHSRIAFAADATCLTNVPVRWRGWLRQRMRWDRNITRNRVRKHRDTYNVRQANFSVRNLLSFVDAVGFGIVLALVWTGYTIDVALSGREHSVDILVVNLILYFMLKVCQFGIALAVSDRRREHARLAPYLPLFELYRVALRLVRIAATLQELLFRASYRDPFAPSKVQAEMEVY